MSIYLGHSGHIELQRRDVNDVFTGTLDPADVDVDNKRFSFDGINGNTTFLITGDRVQFERDSGNIELVEGVTDKTGITYYINIDPLGGIRLYETFVGAINGDIGDGVSLVEPSAAQTITVNLEDVTWRCFAQVSDYSITTNRETIDITTLGEEFRRNYASGLINGQGECNAIWDYEGKDEEYANYLAQLVIRVQLGSMFNGRFYIKDSGRGPIQADCGTSENNLRDQLWWEAKCIVTNVSMSFSPSQIITTQIQFVTSEEFNLKAGIPPEYLLQENFDLILDEQTGEGTALDRFN